MKPRRLKRGKGEGTLKVEPVQIWMTERERERRGRQHGLNLASRPGCSGYSAAPIPRDITSETLGETQT